MKQFRIFLWIALWAISASVAQAQNNPDSSAVHGLRELGSRSFTTGVESTNHSGIPVSNVAELNTAADDLKAVITAAGVTDFKVYDYASYPFLTFMGKEADGDAMMKAMEEKIAAITPAVPYYLLIGKIIDEEGKVVFKVRLKLPVSASKGNGTGNRSAGLFTAETLKELEGDPEKEMNKNAIDQPGLKYYESHEINGILKITKKVKEQLFFSLSSNYYRPDGYPICIPATDKIQIANTSLEIKDFDWMPDGFPQGPVYGWTYKYQTADGVEKENHYKAVFETVNGIKLFKGYHINGVIATGSQYNQTCTFVKDQVYVVRVMNDAKAACRSFSVQGTNYKYVSAPPSNAPLIVTIAQSAKIGNAGYLNTEPDIQIISYGCNSVESDKMKFYFKQFPEKMTPELETAIDAFCMKLSSDKEKYREFFKSKSAGFVGKYPYTNTFVDNYFNPNITKGSESDFIQFVSFIQEVFLPTDFTKWNAPHFVIAEKKMSEYYTRVQPIKNGGVSISLGDIDKYSMITIPEIDGTTPKCRFLMNAFEYISIANRKALINEIFTKERWTTRERFTRNIADATTTDLIKVEAYWNALAPIIMNAKEDDLDEIYALFSTQGFITTFFDKTDPTLALQIAHFLSIKAASKPIAGTKLAQVPCDISQFTPLSTEITLSGTKYQIKFYNLFWENNAWTQQGSWRTQDDFDPVGLNPFDFILLSASTHKTAFKTSILNQFLIDQNGEHYLVTPFLLAAERNLKLKNE